ncbi:hypothetical protein USB125703_00635 [Pseudoclavibacter triregionum]|nr:hypothetical protein USB125703_00635 [Pseudoclavibacter triregionum]
MTALTSGPRLARRLLGALAIGVLAGSALAGCTTSDKVDGPASTGEAGQLADELAGDTTLSTPSGDEQARLAQQALAVLATMPVKPKTEWDGPFDRAGSFGEGWGDPDGNGCDARNDALQANMLDEKLLRDGCRVESGTLNDLYTGEQVPFVKGDTTSDDVQVDHVVALYNAWRTGAQDLTFEQRFALANDPLNLQPTAEANNDDKESKDASQWLPPNAAYQCTYVERQIAVKATYSLWVTQAEHDAMERVLEGCAR